MDATPNAKPLVPERIRPFRRILGAFGDRMPKGLYARALIIIIAPMVLLQSVLTFVFLERHWETVTRRLSTATVQNIAMLIDIYKSYPQDKDSQTLIKLANDDLGLRVKIAPNDELPQTRSRPFFDLLDRTLSDEITRQIGKPFWIDTVGTSNLVDIRIKLDNAVMHVLARRSQQHQSTLGANVNLWDPETAARLKQWTLHFAARGSDSFTAEKQATAMLYNDIVGQAQVLAYSDDFWLLAVLFTVLPLAIPLMRRVRAPAAPKEDEEASGRVEPLPAAE